MIEEKNNKKNKIIKGIALLGLFLMVFGISYALFRVTLNGNKVNKIKIGKMELELLNEAGETIEGDTIGIENAIPISDEEGKALTPYSFTLHNKGTISTEYSITLKDLGLEEGEERLDDKYVTIYLVRGENVTEEIGPFSLNIIKDRIIDAGIIKPGFKMDYKLYMWLDIDADNEASGKVFKTNLEVNGNQINNTTLSHVIVDRKWNKTSLQTLYADGIYDAVGKKVSIDLSKYSSSGDLQNFIRYNFMSNLLRIAGYDTSGLNTLRKMEKEYNKHSELETNYEKEICKEYRIENKVLELYDEYDYIGYADEIYETSPTLTQQLYYEFYLQKGIISSLMDNEVKNITPKLDNNIEELDLTCYSNEKVTNLVLPSNLKKIKSIRNCKLNELIIPNTVESISRLNIDVTAGYPLLSSYSAFSGTTIPELIIPTSVTYINGLTFYNANIGTVTVLGSTTGWNERWCEGFTGTIN